MKNKPLEKGFALTNKYRSALTIVLFLIFSLTAKSQILNFNHSNGFIYEIVGSDSALFIPTGCGAPFKLNMYGWGNATDSARGALYLDSCGHRIYFYDPSLRSWSALSGAGASGVDSIRVRKNGCTDSLKSYSGGVGTLIGLWEHKDGLVPGTGIVTNTDTTAFHITPAVFYINCIKYTTRDTTIILDSPGDTGRIDLVAGNTSGQVTTYKGNPGEGLVVPPYDTETQVPLAFVFITDTSVTFSGGSSGTDDWDDIIGTLQPKTANAVRILRSVSGPGLILSNPTPATNLARLQRAPGILLQGNIRDTSNNLSLVRGWLMQQDMTAGGANPFHWITIGPSENPALFNITLYNTGRVYLPTTGINFDIDGSINRLGTIKINPNTGGTSSALNITNPTSPLSSTTSWVVVDPGVLASAEKAVSLLVKGDRGDSVLYAKTNGTVGIGNNSYNRYLNFGAADKGRGYVLDTMSTLKMQGVTWNIVTVTITNAGTGMTRNHPIVTAVNPINGRPARFTSTVSGGIVTLVSIDDWGSGYTVNGNLVFDTTGCTVGTGNVLPTGTYTVAHGTLPIGWGYFDTDSLCYRSHKGGGLFNNEREGTSGGGGGTNTNIANADLTADADHSTDFDGHGFLLSTGAYSNSSISIDTSNVTLATQSGAGGLRSSLDLSATAGIFGSGTSINSTLRTYRDSSLWSFTKTGYNKGLFNSFDSLVHRYHNEAHPDSNYVTHFPKNYGHRDTLATLRDLRAVGGSPVLDSLEFDSTDFVIDTTVSPKSIQLKNGHGVKVYKANLSQSGTGDPSVDAEFENTIGAIVWTRFGPGTYFGALTGAFPSNKVWSAQPNFDKRFFDDEFTASLIRQNDDYILLSVVDTAGGYTDNFQTMSIEIRIYP